MMKGRSGWLFAIALVCACGPTVHKHNGNGGPDAGGDGAVLPHTLTAVTITPTNPIVQLDLNTSASQPFTVTAVYADNVNEDVTAQVMFTVANPAVGTMSGAALAIPAFTADAAVTSTISTTYAGLIGKAQITVVAYRQSGATPDFFFILPYQDPGGQVTKPLEFSTAVQNLDVFMLMDTTGSMGGEIANLKSALTSTVIPGIQAAVANSAFGVGALEDFPLNGNGSPACTSGDGTADQPFKLRQAITTTSSLITAGVNSLATASGGTIGCGSDLPEAGIEAVYQAATGEGLTGPSPTNVPANHTGIGGVGFRTGTMPVIVSITDAPSHGPGEMCNGTSYAYTTPVSTVAHSRAQAKTAIAGICGRLVGLAANSDGTCDTSQIYLEDLATSSGARVPPAAWDVGTRPAGCAANQCCTDLNGAGRATDVDGLCPMVFKVSGTGTGVSNSVVTGIQMLTRFAAFDVTHSTSGGTTDIAGNPLPTPHTTADFIKMIVPTAFHKPPPPPTLPDPTFDSTNFHNVTPGTKVDFNVDAYNDFVMQTSAAQIFKANIEVQASGCTTLDQRQVIILVPPTPITIQ